MEQDIDKSLHENSLSCDYTKDEWALAGAWCTDEIEKPVEMGYVISHINEVCHFEYVNNWLKIKVEALGWPSGCNTEEQQQAYVEDFERQILQITDP